MDIQAIQDNITELEDDVTTLDNVDELASLYIVREYLLKSTKNNVDKVTTEVNDILPSYHNYVDIKIKYQQGTVDEDKLISALDLLCQEIREFLDALYSSTDFYKERRKLQAMINDVATFYTDR